MKLTHSSSLLVIQVTMVALLVPDVSVLHLFEENDAFSIRDKYSHLAVCLNLIQPHWRKRSFGPTPGLSNGLAPFLAFFETDLD